MWHVGNLRCRVDLIEEAAPVVAVKNARESPGPVLEWLNVHDLDEKNIAGLGALDLEGAAQVVHARQVNVAHIVGRVIVANLPTRPVQALDFDSLPILDGAREGDCVALLLGSFVEGERTKVTKAMLTIRVPSILGLELVSKGQ